MHKSDCIFMEDGSACNCGQITQEEWDRGVMVRGTATVNPGSDELKPMGKKRNVVVASVLCAILSMGAVLSFFSIPADGQAGTAIVRPNPPYWEVLAKSSITAAGNRIPVSGNLTFQARKRLRITLYISGYGGAGETASWQFNGDTGNNYKVICSTTADGITWAAGTNNAVSTDRIRVAPANSTRSRNVEALITNDPGQVDKTVGMMITVTGTGSAATNSSIDVCNGGWISAANTQITQLAVVTSTANMGARSSVVVEGSNF